MSPWHNNYFSKSCYQSYGDRSTIKQTRVYPHVMSLILVRIQDFRERFSSASASAFSPTKVFTYLNFCPFQQLSTLSFNKKVLVYPCVDFSANHSSPPTASHCIGENWTKTERDTERERVSINEKSLEAKQPKLLTFENNCTKPAFGNHLLTGALAHQMRISSCQ